MVSLVRMVSLVQNGKLSQNGMSGQGVKCIYGSNMSIILFLLLLLFRIKLYTIRVIIMQNNYSIIVYHNVIMQRKIEVHRSI